MKTSNLFSIVGILLVTTFAWFILGSAIQTRTDEFGSNMRKEVQQVWGPNLHQQHPVAFYLSPNVPEGKALIQSEKSRVRAFIHYEPKKRGLMSHRTYDVNFEGNYTFRNPTRIQQTLFLQFPLPDTQGLKGVKITLDGKDTDVRRAADGSLELALEVGASTGVELKVVYQTNGTNSWLYEFPQPERIQDFELFLKTNFSEYSFPTGCGSPTQRDEKNCEFTWAYQPDVLSAPNIGMDMPKLLNPAPVASRISFFAPVSLLFFVTVLLLLASLKGLALHPMHVCFVAAGFFAFHLLFAYLTDVIPMFIAFGVAAIVSVILVCSYLRAVGGNALLRIALPAQIGYMVLFSVSFFFDGLTGLTIAIGSVITLALLMKVTAKTPWKDVFTTKAQRRPPVIPSLQSNV
jgi:hypothetical protein